MRRAWWLLWALMPMCCLAGNIHFGLARQDGSLQVTNLGSVSAYYPAVLRLQVDGTWMPLAPEGSAPAILPSHRSAGFAWPAPALTGLPGRSAPVMVRFFDQAGTAFGQISFFDEPPAAELRVEAAYERDGLVIRPPAGEQPAATWVLWAQEEGIAPLAGVQDFVHRQPAARRIDWPASRSAVRIVTGAARPMVWLVHETPQGYALQTVAGAGRPGNEQRAAWLDSVRALYAVALVALAGALVALWRRRPVAGGV